MSTARATRPLQACLLVLSAVFLVIAVNASFGLGSAPLEDFVNNWLYDPFVLACGLVCLVRATRSTERAAWTLVGIGIIAWGIGDIYWTQVLVKMEEPPFPSIADAFWLALYPPTYIALAMLARSRFADFRASMCLDGVVGALAIAALGAAVLFEFILEATGGERAAVVATNLSYPIGDMLLIALVVGVFAAAGWRAERTWTLFAVGLLVFAASDALFLYETAAGTYEQGSITDIGWAAGLLLIAWAAWQPATGHARARLDGWWVLVPPTLFAAVALGVLIYDHFVRVNLLALGLAAAALVAIVGRLALTFRENMLVIAASRAEALTDPLTGLGNRRRLMRELDEYLAAPDGRRLLVLLDLNGFKQYNDTFGHPAGDALLARLGRRLGAYASGCGAGFRMGGDEFCVLATLGEESPEAIGRGAARMLSESGDGFSISSAYGWVIAPEEAADTTNLLRIADERLYANKHARPSSAREQSSSVLVQALSARHPSLGDHVVGVAGHAFAVAVELGMPPDELHELRIAAALHDVGKMAVPDTILEKTGPLDDEEWQFVRRHTLIGEKILQAAPALSKASRLVRHSHEWYDGTGYPDGIAGTDIPLGSRVIFVCDAFDAMTAVRPYSPAMSPADAFAELERCAGTQFDPVVVQAFKRVYMQLQHAPRIAAVA